MTGNDGHESPIQVSDDSIKECIFKALGKHRNIDSSKIEADVDHGAVILRGEVHSLEEKTFIENLVDGLQSVKEVHNQLHLGSAAR